MSYLPLLLLLACAGSARAAPASKYTIADDATSFVQALQSSTDVVFLLGDLRVPASTWPVDAIELSRDLVIQGHQPGANATYPILDLDWCASIPVCRTSWHVVQCLNSAVAPPVCMSQRPLPSQRMELWGDAHALPAQACSHTEDDQRPSSRFHAAQPQTHHRYCCCRAARHIRLRPGVTLTLRGLTLQSFRSNFGPDFDIMIYSPGGVLWMEDIIHVGAQLWGARGGAGKASWRGWSQAVTGAGAGRGEQDGGLCRLRATVTKEHGTRWSY